LVLGVVHRGVDGAREGAVEVHVRRIEVAHEQRAAVPTVCKRILLGGCSRRDPIVFTRRYANLVRRYSSFRSPCGLTGRPSGSAPCIVGLTATDEHSTRDPCETDACTPQHGAPTNHATCS